MKTLLLAVALAGCTQSALAADAASGSFKSEDLAMQVKSTLAFNGRLTLDKADVIVLAVRVPTWAPMRCPRTALARRGRADRRRDEVSRQARR